MTGGIFRVCYNVDITALFIIAWEEFACGKIRIILHQNGRTWMSVTMVEGDYMVAVGFYKLIEGVAHIAIINVHDAGIRISDSH